MIQQFFTFIGEKIAMWFALPWWEKSVHLLIVFESLILLLFLSEWIRKKKRDSAFLFLALAFSANLLLHLIPFFYELSKTVKPENWLLDTLDCILAVIKTFLGEGDSSFAKEFAKTAPAFSVAYLLGVTSVLIATVNAGLQAFSFNLRNKKRLFFALRGRSCDIVLGTDENALRYAKDGAAIVVPVPYIDKNSTLRLIERGYTVLRRSFSKELLASRILTHYTEYNIICPGKTDKNLEHLDTFISYFREEKRHKKIRLFVEIEGEKANTIRREIIDKSPCKKAVITFCSNELLARMFAEAHPLTEYMPRDFLEEDTSMKGDVGLHVTYLGFGALNREMYRQSILNNQFVTWRDGEYHTFPVNYHLFDTAIDKKDWLIDGLKTKLESFEEKKEQYYPLPPLPYCTTTYDRAPQDLDTLDEVETIIRQEKTFHYVIVDVGDTYLNIEAGSRLRAMLSDTDNYHIFIRSETAYVEDDARITYLGDADDIFTHDIIVNDALSKIAYKLNEIYTLRDIEKDEQREPTPEEKRTEPQKSWDRMDFFTRYSNLYAALNMRVKLQLLGLDYTREPMAEIPGWSNTDLLNDRYQRPDRPFPFANYLQRSTYTALLAQEKTRWNAYHLLSMVLPKRKDTVVIVEEIKNGKKKPKATTKDEPLTHHACVTTYAGLAKLSEDLRQKWETYSKELHKIEEYDYYQNDDQLLAAVTDLMEELGCSVYQKIHENNGSEE